MNRRVVSQSSRGCHRCARRRQPRSSSASTSATARTDVLDVPALVEGPCGSTESSCHLRRPRRPQSRDRLRVRRRGVATLPGPLPAQHPSRIPRGNAGWSPPPSARSSPNRRRARPLPADAIATMLGRQSHPWKRCSTTPGRHPRLHLVPGRALEEDLVDQPRNGSTKRSNAAPDRRRRLPP